MAYACDKPWKIKLSLALTDIILPTKESFFKCALFLSSQNEISAEMEWYPVAVTEKIVAAKTTHFSSNFFVYYRFEVNTPLKFILYHVEDADTDIMDEKQPPPSLYEQQRVSFGVRPLGIPPACQIFAESISFHLFYMCELGYLITARNKIGQLPLLLGTEEKGMLLVSSEDSSNDRYNLRVQFRGRKLPTAPAFTRQASKIRILSQTPASSEWRIVASSMPVDNTNPIWELQEATLRDLCDGDSFVKCLRIEVEVGGKIIGGFSTSVDQLLEGNEFYLTSDNNAKGFDLGSVVLLHYDLHLLPSFLDYISNGWEVHLITSIDFTASNGNPTSPTSLHHISNMPNDYEKAIQAFGGVLTHYNPFKLIRAFGYGALLAGESAVSNCFALNNNIETPEVNDVQGVLDAYHACLDSVVFKGPTVISNTIREAMEFASDPDNSRYRYTVLLIITDGVIFDWRDTIDALVASARLPLSIFIIGVGKSDFSKMLSLNTAPIVSSIGEEAIRHNVHFVSPVHQDESRNTLESYNTQCLRLLPLHMMEYLRHHEIPAPGDPFCSEVRLHSSNTPKTFTYTQPPEWDSDTSTKSCGLCNTPFSFLTRKHHCRACGKIVCALCSSYTAPIPNYNLTTPQRCCDTCYALLIRTV